MIKTPLSILILQSNLFRRQISYIPKSFLTATIHRTRCRLRRGKDPHSEAVQSLDVVSQSLFLIHECLRKLSYIEFIPFGFLLEESDFVSVFADFVL